MQGCIGGEAHLPFAVGNTVIFLLISLEKHGCGLLLAEHLYERVFEVPTVVQALFTALGKSVQRNKRKYNKQMLLHTVPHILSLPRLGGEVIT